MIKLDKMPLPPSSNKLYSSFRGRLIKSKDGREFDQKIETYAFLHKRKIETARKQVNELLANGFKALRIDCYFVFHKNKIIGQKGQIKRIDAQNRLKQAIDNTAKILEIDDSIFSEGFFIKIICQEIKDEQMIVEIKQAQFINYEDI